MLLSDGTFAAHDYDCFIAGSGPAGMSLALALGEAKKRVLIFESGEEQIVRQELSNSIGYGHYSGAYWNAHWIRTLGGTSAVWAGWCTIPSELDFDNPAIGVRWPIGRDELLPYWRRAAPLLNHDPALIDFEVPMFPGFAFRPVLVPDPGPTHFGHKYLQNLKDSAFVDVLTGCSVASLESNESRSAVTGVWYFDHRMVVRRHFNFKPGQSLVLAAGGIGNPQLLLQPRADGSAPVGNESGQVGRFLTEHPHFAYAGECVLDRSLNHYWPHGVPRGANAIVADRALSSEQGLYGCNLECLSKGRRHPVVRYLSDRFGTTFYRYDVMVRSEMVPSAGNRVFLTGERQASGMFRPGVRCVLDARDFLNVEMTLRLLGEALIRRDRGRVKVNNDQIYKDLHGGGHIMGTTRMGDNPSTSVVDRHCRVHGYHNLFVSGSSVFCTGAGYANPTLTIVALSLRLADTITKATT